MERIKLFEEFVNEKNDNTYSYGCVMLYFDFPNIKKITETTINKKQIIISFLDFLKKNMAGTVNKEIQNKLKE